MLECLTERRKEKRKPSYKYVLKHTLHLLCAVTLEMAQPHNKEKALGRCMENYKTFLTLSVTQPHLIMSI